jgi:hypothetical protein
MMGTRSYREMASLEAVFLTELDYAFGCDVAVPKLNEAQKDALTTISHELGPYASAFVRHTIRRWHNLARKVEGLQVTAPRTPSLVFCARHLDELYRLAQEAGAFEGIDASSWSRDPSPADLNGDSVRI